MTINKANASMTLIIGRYGIAGFLYLLFLQSEFKKASDVFGSPASQVPFTNPSSSGLLRLSWARETPFFDIKMK